MTAKKHMDVLLCLIAQVFILEVSEKGKKKSCEETREISCFVIDTKSDKN